MLTNPYDESRSSTSASPPTRARASRRELQGFPVAGRIGEGDRPRSIAGAQTSRGAPSGRADARTLVVGRAQLYDGGGRLGYSMTLGAPALRDAVVVRQRREGRRITERFSIYNPTDDDVEVDAVFLGIAASAEFSSTRSPCRPARS